jgi:hypothetical protein
VRLEGTFEVAADTTLLGVDWRFVTPKLDEDAGGTASFVPPDATPAVLTPARSVYWRRLGGRRDRYYQEAAVYRAWAYSVGDMWPDLPAPSGDGVP